MLLAEDMTKVVAEQRTFVEAVDQLKYSPDNSKLAAGSHDNFVDIFDVTRGCGAPARWPALELALVQVPHHDTA